MVPQEELDLLQPGGRRQGIKKQALVGSMLRRRLF